MELLNKIILQTGFIGIEWQQPIMWVIACIFLYLAIAKKVEPLLLVPIGFTVLIVNLPGGWIYSGSIGSDPRLLDYFYTYGLKTEIIPCLIFLGLGALTDFGPLISNPITLLLGAAAQFGVYLAFFGSILLGFDIKEACSIGIIGGADGPTTIYITQLLAPHILGATAIAAYSYIAMVPIIQPPIIKLFTTKEERGLIMKQLRKVSRLEKILFPIATAIGICLLIPASAPLVGMFMLGNIFRESGVVERLTKTAQEELLNIVTIFLGITVGTTMVGHNFIQVKVILIYFLGLVAFSFGTAGGILFAKFLNLFLKNKINPLLGSAGVSAVPMAARVSHKMGQEANPQCYLLMHAMGPNVAGVIGTLVAAGIFIMLAS